MNKEINSNGYNYVDLGLPSGTFWATMNVGASKPSDCGLYFQWGDTQGYTANQVGKDKQFNWKDYKFSIDGSYSNFSKYATNGATLDLEDDAANANMGGDWHMPTDVQIYELINNTTANRTTLDGVSGITFTSIKDTSKFIFIPAAGDAWDGSVQVSGGGGYVWSSMLDADNVNNGQYLVFSSRYVGLDDDGRCDGLSVRGVIDSKQDKNGNTNINKENDR